MNIALEGCRECLHRILHNFTRKMYIFSVPHHPMSLTLLIIKPLEAHNIKLFHLRAPSLVVSLALETVKPTVSLWCMQDYSIKVEVARSLVSSLWNPTDLQLLTLEQTSFHATQLEWPPSRLIQGPPHSLPLTCRITNGPTHRCCLLTSTTRMVQISWMAPAI